MVEEMSDAIDITELEQIPGFISSNEEEEDINQKLDREVEDQETEEEESEEVEDTKKKKKTKLSDKEVEDEINSILDKETIVPSAKEKKGKEKVDDKEDGFSALSTIKALRDRNLIEFDDPEDGEEPYTEDEALDILEESIDERVELLVEDKIKGLDNVTKTILKYAMNGGNVIDVIKQISNQQSTSISADIDLSNEDNQELVIKETLSQNGFDNEYIETQLEFLKDNGKLEMFAKKQFKTWKENNDKEFEKTLKQQEDAKREYERRFKETKSKLNNTINSTEKIGGLTISNRDKKDLASYIMDRTVKTNGANITNFHADLGEVLKDETASIQLAKLLRSRDKDGKFDFSVISKEVETQVTDKVKRNLRRTNTNIPTSQRGGGNEGRSLADILKEDFDG